MKTVKICYNFVTINTTCFLINVIKITVGVITQKRPIKTNKNMVCLSHSNYKLLMKLKAGICGTVHSVHSYAM
jgi:hypothetical protein